MKLVNETGEVGWMRMRSTTNMEGQGTMMYQYKKESECVSNRWQDWQKEECNQAWSEKLDCELERGTCDTANPNPTGSQYKDMVEVEV